MNKPRLLAGLLACSLAIHSNFLHAQAPGVINLRDTVTVEVVKQTKDAVVNISASKLVSRRINPFGDDPFFGRMDLGQVVQVPANSLGSGFIIHADGYVVTNNHVIDRAREINVELADGRKLKADLVSADADADLAVLKITDPAHHPFPTLTLGASADLMIGEPVIAVGNPLGYSHSVSTGIVSAVHRDLKDLGGEESTSESLKDLVQTDAAINPGNSGGPLLNAYGQVIGINTAIRGDAQNIGFAIGVDHLRDLIPQLMNPGPVIHREVGARLHERRDLSPPATVRATVMLATGNGESPVVTIDGRHPADIVDAYAVLLRTPADAKSVLFATADGHRYSAEVRAAPQPDAVVQAKAKLGLTVVANSPQMAERYGLAAEDGVLITGVDGHSPASTAGLHPGDILVQLGRYRITTLADLNALLHKLPGTGKIKVGVLRGEHVGYGTIELGAASE